MGHGWGFVRLLTLCLARGGGGLIHFFALPFQRGGGLVHFSVCFALCGGGLVDFSPLPCPSKNEYGHFNNPVGKGSGTRAS